jgi:hypothetical protein
MTEVSTAPNFPLQLSGHLWVDSEYRYKCRSWLRPDYGALTSLERFENSLDRKAALRHRLRFVWNRATSELAVQYHELRPSR